MKKKILLFFIFIFALFFNLSLVSADECSINSHSSYVYVNDFESSLSLSSTGSVVSSIVNSGASIDFSRYFNGSSSMRLNGSSHIQYNLNNLTTFDISFYFYKSDSASYPRLLYLMGINREIEIKGSSSNLYIGSDVSTSWAQNTWNLIRITRDSNNLISYYINGDLVKSETNSSNLTGLRLGAGSSTSSNRFNGFIDNLSIDNNIYNKAIQLNTDIYPLYKSFDDLTYNSTIKNNTRNDLLNLAIERTNSHNLTDFKDNYYYIVSTYDSNDSVSYDGFFYDVKITYWPKSNHDLQPGFVFRLANDHIKVSFSYLYSVSIMFQNNWNASTYISNGYAYGHTIVINSNTNSVMKDSDFASDDAVWFNYEGYFNYSDYSDYVLLKNPIDNYDSHSYLYFDTNANFYIHDYINRTKFASNALSPLILNDFNHLYCNRSQFISGYVSPYVSMDYIDIPITDLYDSESNTWKPFLKYFNSLNDNNSYNFYIRYFNDSSSNLPTIPLELFVNNNVVDIEFYNRNVMNSNYSSANGYGGGFSIGGGTFGGGGGGGRITSSDSCLNPNSITYSNGNLTNLNTYGVLILSPNSCDDISNNTPSDFSTRYIRIYFDVNFYNSFNDVEDHYLNNINDVINGDDNSSSSSGSSESNSYSIKSAFHYFVSPIREIMSLITAFYNSCPTKFKYLMIAIFVISIYLVVVRFIL